MCLRMVKERREKKKNTFTKCEVAFLFVFFVFSPFRMDGGVKQRRRFCSSDAIRTR